MAILKYDLPQDDAPRVEVSVEQSTTVARVFRGAAAVTEVRLESTVSGVVVECDVFGPDGAVVATAKSSGSDAAPHERDPHAVHDSDLESLQREALLGIANYIPPEGGGPPGPYFPPPTREEIKKMKCRSKCAAKAAIAGAAAAVAGGPIAAAAAAAAEAANCLMDC